MSVFDVNVVRNGVIVRASSSVRQCVASLLSSLSICVNAVV